MIEEVSRRTFLKVLGAAIATPIIARVALDPTIQIPGIQRIHAVTKADLATDARFANAIFTPGNFRGACDLIQVAITRHLPQGVNFEVRAVPLPIEMMRRYVRYGRSGYAVVWVTDASMQRPDFLHADAEPYYGTEYFQLGRARTGEGILLGSTSFHGWVTGIPAAL